jgi:hypothetical protein
VPEDVEAVRKTGRLLLYPQRGIIGTFHHVSPEHLQRYCHEFDFRYNHRQVKRTIDRK